MSSVPRDGVDGARSESEGVRKEKIRWTRSGFNMTCREFQILEFFASRLPENQEMIFDVGEGEVAIYRDLLATRVKFPFQCEIATFCYHFKVSPAEICLKLWCILLGFMTFCE